MMGLLAVIGAFVFIAIATVWEGYALSVLWGWFAVPIFGLPALAIPQAIGVAVVCAMLTKQYVPSKTDDHGIWFYIAAKPAVALLVGWIVLKFM